MGKKQKKEAQKPLPSKAKTKGKWVAILLVCGLVLAGLAYHWWQTSTQLELPYHTATAVAILDMNSGRIIYQEEGDFPHSPASLTKLMTLLLVYEAVEEGQLAWTDTFLMTEEEAYTSGSKLGTYPGEVLTVEQLVAGTVMASGCDCVQALVKLVAGGEEAFVDLMNQKATELGLEDTSFVNATGIDSQDHYMTAVDLAYLAQILVETYPEILDYTSQASLEIEGRRFTNTHGLVGYDEKILGLKTGTTLIGGYSLITYTKEGDQSYMIVLLNATNEHARLSETQTIIDILYEEED